MPEDVTWEEGAMTEPLACVILSLALNRLQTR